MLYSPFTCAHLIYRCHQGTTRYSNPLKQKFRAKRMAAESRFAPFSLFCLTDTSSSVDGAAAAPAPKRPTVQMPDEYLPPNKILFLQNLPESVTKDQLMALFSQLASYPHFTATSVDFHSPDIQTCTKFGSSPQNGTSRSWSIWTRRAQGLPRTLCITISSTGRTRSRHVSYFVVRLVLIRSIDHLCTQVIIYCMIVVSLP